MTYMTARAQRMWMTMESNVECGCCDAQTCVTMCYVSTNGTWDMGRNDEYNVASQPSSRGAIRTSMQSLTGIRKPQDGGAHSTFRRCLSRLYNFGASKRMASVCSSSYTYKSMDDHGCRACCELMENVKCMLRCALHTRSPLRPCCYC